MATTAPDIPSDPLRPFESARLRIARLAVHDGQPLPAVFRRVCEIAADTLDIERVGIWMMTTDGKALRCANLYLRSRGDHSEGVTLQVVDFPNYFRAVANRRALPTEMVQSDPRTANLDRINFTLTFGGCRTGFTEQHDGTQYSYRLRPATNFPEH